MRTELSIDASGHDVADTNIVVAMVQHHGFAEAVEAEFRGIIGRRASERVLTGQTAHVNDVATTTLT